MNRFVVEGIARECAQGKDVLCLIPSRAITQAIAALEEMPDVAHIYRANGRQSVTFKAGGRVTFASPEQGGGRGHTEDLVVIDDVYYRDNMQTICKELRPALSVSGGEIITYT